LKSPKILIKSKLFSTARLSSSYSLLKSLIHPLCRRRQVLSYKNLGGLGNALRVGFEDSLIEFANFVPVKIHDFSELAQVNVPVDLSDVVVDVCFDSMELFLQGSIEEEIFLYLGNPFPTVLLLFPALFVVLLIHFLDYLLPFLLNFLLQLLELILNPGLLKAEGVPLPT